MKSSNEKLAISMSGLENGAKHFVINGKSAEELAEIEASERYNTKISEYANRYEEYAASLAEVAEKYASRPDNLEIKAIGNNIIVYPLSVNPFQQIKTDGLIITDLGGLAPTFKSQEDGEIHEEEQFVKVAQVFDAGPECKWVQDGDIVMYTKPSATPIPFYKQHICQISEQRVLCVINTDLTERFKK